MLDAKQAVEIAKDRAIDLLGPCNFSLEEIERETYKGHEVWSITLSHPRSSEPMGPLGNLGTPLLQYLRFLIDAATGELVAIKLRELASQ